MDAWNKLDFKICLQIIRGGAWRDIRGAGSSRLPPDGDSPASPAAAPHGARWPRAVQRLALHSSSHLMITTDAMLKVQVQEMRDLMSSSNSEYNFMQIFS